MAHLQRSTIPPKYFLNGEDEDEDFQGGLEEDDPSLSLDSNSRRRREAARLRAHQQQQQERAKQNEGIAKKESRAVFYLRLCVLIVLLCSTVAVSTAVYLYTTHKENQLRNAQFENGAETVLENVGQTLSQTLAATDGFIVQMVAYARYSNSSWPFVTLPKFGLHAAKLLQLSRAFYFSVYPIVHHDQRQEWERYANQSRSWINESLEFQARDTDWKGPVQRDYNFSYEIYASAERYHGEPFDYAIPPNTYLPSWQVSPLVPAR